MAYGIPRAQSPSRVGESQAQAKARLARWRRSACYLGVALALNIGALSPFLFTNSFNSVRDTVGRGLVMLSMALLIAFLYAAATSVNIWYSNLQLKKIDSISRTGRTKSANR